MSDETSTEREPPVLGPVLACFLVLAASFATRSIISLGMAAWQTDLGWTRSQVSAVGALGLCAMASTVPFAGYLADRFGSRRILTLGCVMLGAGLGVTAGMHSLWQLALGYGLMAGIGFGLASLPVVSSFVVQTVRRNVGLATGAATAGSTAGQLVLLPLAAASFAVVGWRGGFLGVAATALAAGALAWFLLPARNGPKAVASGGQAPAGLGQRLAPIVRTPAFHGLFWSFALCGFTSTGMVETHLIPFAQSCGFPPLPSSLAYAVFAACNLVGMLTAGWLADRMDRRVLLASIFALRALAFIIPLFVGVNYTLLLSFTVVVGLAFYATFPAIVGLSAAHFGRENLGLVMGVLTVGHSVSAAAGAWAGGLIYDMSLKYDWAWMLSIGLALCAALLATLTPDPRSRPKAPPREPLAPAAAGA